MTTGFKVGYWGNNSYAMARLFASASPANKVIMKPNSFQLSYPVSGLLSHNTGNVSYNNSDDIIIEKPKYIYIENNSEPDFIESVVWNKIPYIGPNYSMLRLQNDITLANKIFGQLDCLKIPETFMTQDAQTALSIIFQKHKIAQEEDREFDTKYILKSNNKEFPTIVPAVPGEELYLLNNEPFSSIKGSIICQEWKYGYHYNFGGFFNSKEFIHPLIHNIKYRHSNINYDNFLSESNNIVWMNYNKKQEDKNTEVNKVLNYVENLLKDKYIGFINISVIVDKDYNMWFNGISFDIDYMVKNFIQHLWNSPRSFLQNMKMLSEKESFVLNVNEGRNIGIGVSMLNNSGNVTKLYGLENIEDSIVHFQPLSFVKKPMDVRMPFKETTEDLVNADWSLFTIPRQPVGMVLAVSDSIESASTAVYDAVSKINYRDQYYYNPSAKDMKKSMNFINKFLENETEEISTETVTMTQGDK